jgi:hypothetical protein
MPKIGYLRGNADSNETNACSPNHLHLIWKFVDVASWITVSDENRNVRYVRAIAILWTENICSHDMQAASGIRVPTAVRNKAYGTDQRIEISVVVQIKDQRRVVTCDKSIQQ